MRPPRFVAPHRWLLAVVVGFTGCGGGMGGAGTGASGSGGVTATDGQGALAGQMGTGGGSGGSAAGGVGGAGGTAGRRGTGDSIATGGAIGSGGRAATGGSAGTGGSGGRIGSGGSGGRAGAGGASAFTCKRGIAANTAPGAAFYPAVRWWYNWSLSPSGGNTGIEFVPMIWGSSTVDGAIPAGARYLLGFNEPNFMAQSNLTAQAAAGLWPMVQANGREAGVTAIVGPALNFCGPAANCNGTDPYVYLSDFLNACTGCEVDHIAVHWYNCDLPSLRAYIESNSSLAGWVQFGKPIWLTEFSCDGSATEAQQEAFMRAAVPYLESQPNVFRYSWFSADPIPNGKLLNTDGSPTALGQVYISLPSTCP